MAGVALAPGRDVVSLALSLASLDAVTGEVRDAALAYANRGWPVFPCYEPNGTGCSCGKRDCTNAAKHPRTVHGFKDATTDREQIRAWWARWPDANIATPTGGGRVVVDVDPRNGGDDALAELERRYGQLPATFEVITGGGGRHLWFAGNAPKGSPADGIDLQGEGAYVLLPPSRHVSGRVYTVELSSPPPEQMAPLPVWLTNGHGALTPGREIPPTIHDGEGRERYLASLAGTLRHRGLSEDEILTALRAVNEARWPPKPEADLQRIARSFARYAPGGASAEAGRDHPAGARDHDAGARDHDAGRDHPVPPPDAAGFEGVRVVPAAEIFPTTAPLPTEGQIVPPPSNPMAVARQFVAEKHTTGGMELIRHHRGDFHAWDGTCWPEVEDRTVRADLYRWLECSVYAKDQKKLAPFEPNRKKLGDVLDAVQAIGHLPAHVAPPTWIDADDETPASEIIAMSNGLLHLPTRRLRPHTPGFFTLHSLPFAYDPTAGSPARWEGFLDELWMGDNESKDTLGELMGYVLGGGTSQQKMFLLVGPKRSGKGTIGRVLTGLLGQHNTASPTLASLTGNFGLQALVGKPLAVISDARLGNRTDGLIAVERLLSISGEDGITVDRKYKDPWTGRLPTRFLILTNEIPKFTDSSGALASRFIMLTTSKSFYDREDPGLTDALVAESRGIFNWALQGLDRLVARGHFKQPESSREAIRHLEDLSSPVGAFVRDRCQVGPAFEVDKDQLFESWKAWCTEEGRDRPGTKNVFARDLRAAVPGLTARRPLEGADRVHVYRGLRLGWEQQWRTTLTNPDRQAEQPQAVRDAPTQNPRSERVVRDGQGSPPLRAVHDPKHCGGYRQVTPGGVMVICSVCGAGVEGAREQATEG